MGVSWDVFNELWFMVDIGGGEKFLENVMCFFLGCFWNFFLLLLGELLFLIKG